jgi:hypothetical protein
MIKLRKNVEVQIRMRKFILPITCGVGWGGMVWLGFSLEEGVQARTGCVALGQIVFYVGWPLAALIACLLPWALLDQTKFSTVGNLWCGFFLLLLVWYLILWIWTFGI